MTKTEQLQKERAALDEDLVKLRARLDKANDEYDKLKERLNQEGLLENLKFLLEVAERHQTELRRQRNPLLKRITEVDKLLASQPVASPLKERGKFVNPFVPLSN